MVRERRARVANAECRAGEGKRDLGDARDTSHGMRGLSHAFLSRGQGRGSGPTQRTTVRGTSNVHLEIHRKHPHEHTRAMERSTRCSRHHTQASAWLHPLHSFVPARPHASLRTPSLATTTLRNSAHRLHTRPRTHDDGSPHPLPTHDSTPSQTRGAHNSPPTPHAPSPLQHEEPTTATNQRHHGYNDFAPSCSTPASPQIKMLRSSKEELKSTPFGSSASSGRAALPGRVQSRPMSSTVNRISSGRLACGHLRWRRRGCAHR
jgi:hypothetical protein